MGSGIHPVVDVAAFQQIVHFAVGGDDFTKAPGFQHGALHHFVALHASSVIGIAAHIPCQAFHVHQLLTLFPQRDGAVGMHPDAGVLPDERQLLFQMRFRIRHGGKVGHGAHVGVAPMGRSQAAGQYGFFIRKTRLTEMHMHVTQAGKNNKFTGKRNRGTAASVEKQCGVFTGSVHFGHCPAHVSTSASA